MDSVTLAHHLHAEGRALLLVSIDYGQRHAREIDCAAACAGRLDARHAVVDLADLREHLHGSALTDEAVAVPEGHYTDESMRATVVPNRNAILLSVAWGIAVAEGADLVATAVHGGDHAIYPDCRPEFIDALGAALRLGTAGHHRPGLYLAAPFLGIDKAGIVRIGAELGVPFEATWSCYLGGRVHCGRCGTCVERREAFAVAGVVDPTSYEAAA
jgi:7-cyano-7-deazaguanine synthase